MNRRPDFLIIGAMKSATSTLHEQLAAQPGIFMSSPKELYFFSDDDVYSKGMSWYLNHFGDANGDDLCGESSTHYSKLPTYPETVQRIQKELGCAKFIYVMRDPIDRLVSQYIHHWTMKETKANFDDCLSVNDTLVAYSEYARQLRPYFDVFGARNILPVFFDRLRSSPQAELERVCRFIGFQGKPTWVDALSGENNSASRMRTSGLRDALLDVPVLSHLRRFMIPHAVREHMKGFWQMKERPQLSERWRERITPRINADLEELGKLLNIRLTSENFKIATTSLDHSPDWCKREDVAGNSDCDRESVAMVGEAQK